MVDTCFYCGINVYKDHERRNKHNYPLLTLDHVIPKARTRGTENNNTVVACEECNTAKRDLTIEEYRVLLAFRYGHVSGVEFKFAGE